MTGFPNAFAWRAACAADAVLTTWAGPWAVCFAIKSGSDATIFKFVEGQVAADPGTPAFILAAPEAMWARFLEPVPPRHHHGIFAMMRRTLERVGFGPGDHIVTHCEGGGRAALGAAAAVRRLCRCAGLLPELRGLGT